MFMGCFPPHDSSTEFSFGESLAIEISIGTCSTSLAIPKAIRIRKARLFRLVKDMFMGCFPPHDSSTEFSFGKSLSKEILYRNMLDKSRDTECD
jgi:hypothetical protein